MLLYNWLQIKNFTVALVDSKQQKVQPRYQCLSYPAFPGRKEEKTWDGKRTSLVRHLFSILMRAQESRDGSFQPWRALFGPLNFCLFITCIRIRFDGQFREWASTRRCDPLLTSGSWKAVTGYTCGLQVSVLSSFQKLQRSLTLTALESTYELVTSLLGWNLSVLIDDIFTAKWSCEYLLNENIKWWTLHTSNS